MSFYGTYILPALINLSMQNRAASAERAKLIPLASGTVLEVGVGSGLNFRFYPPGLCRLYALDPSAALLRMARRRVSKAAVPVEIVRASAEEIPLADEVTDTVVMTWTLCSIPDPLRALGEVRRVLKPGGRLIFVEHGRSPDPKVLAWQNRLNRLWPHVSGGCNLDRPIDRLITDAGFEIVQMETGYADGPKPLAYLYRGLARC